MTQKSQSRYVINTLIKTFYLHSPNILRANLETYILKKLKKQSQNITAKQLLVQITQNHEKIRYLYDVR